jgi:hypothetical protein
MKELPIISISVTPDQLEQAFLTWQHRFRGGMCESYQDTLAKPVETAARESAEVLWGLLINPVRVS